jgi:hypothetical protein
LAEEVEDSDFNKSPSFLHFLEGNRLGQYAIALYE